MIVLSSPVDADSCLDCHSVIDSFKGVITDWEGSTHAQENVSCMNCHEAEAAYTDEMYLNGCTISPIVSPLDCAECHSMEAQEFEQSLHSLGSDYYELLFDKEKLPFLESQIEGGYIAVQGEGMTHATVQI